MDKGRLNQNAPLAELSLLPCLYEQVPTLADYIEEETYGDIPEEAWYMDYTKISYALNMFPQNEPLSPDTPIAREEIARILYELHIQKVFP